MPERPAPSALRAAARHATFAVVRAKKGRSDGRGTIPALALLALWSLGFEALPLAHALEHAATPTATHCHDGTCHDDDDAPAGIATGGHGDHTLAHRDVAATTPGDGIVRWPAFVVGEALDIAPIAAPITGPTSRDAVARGPPRA